MTMTSTSRTAPAWLHELVASRTNYEERYGWPAVVEVSSRSLKLPVGRVVDAISMPAELGAAVQFHLRLAMLDGPVIAGRGRLTFLTEPSPMIVPLLPLDLESAQVRLAAHGEYVPLPIAPAIHRLRDLRWLNPPRPRRKPPGWSAVVGAARRAVAVRSVDTSMSRAA